MTAKLTDLQLVLLSAAAARPDGSLLPPSDSVGQRARIRKTIPALLKRGLTEEVDVASAEQSWRKEHERHVGVVITDAGRSAIGIGPGVNQAAPAKISEAPSPAAVALASEAEPPLAARVTKSAQVLALLRREDGATLTELVDATGWLPHTTRAALTGLRKKGHAIVRDKRGDQTCYRTAAAA